MIRERRYPFIAPISSQHAYRITKPEDSEAVNGEEYEWFVFGRRDGKSLKTVKNDRYLRNVLSAINSQCPKCDKKRTEIDIDAITQPEPIRVTIEKEQKNDWLLEEKENIIRAASAEKLDGIGPLVLKENG